MNIQKRKIEKQELKRMYLVKKKKIMMKKRKRKKKRMKMNPKMNQIKVEKKLKKRKE